MVLAPPLRRLLAPALVVLAVAAGCSSSDSASDATSNTTEGAPYVPYTATEVTRPPAEGKGINQPQPSAPLPDGYVEEEYFVGGTATSFEAVDTPDDGFWTAAPAAEAEYRTRVVVRRPADAAAFSGTVVLEWFNVTAIEASPDWGFLSDEIGREGDAYIGVSAQALGVEGGESVLDVAVDEQQAAAANVDTSKSGLKNGDPDRYGTLVHPGDAYAYDIFTQVGRVAADSPAQLLGGLQPTQVIAAGESQSAMFMTTLINAIHPLAPVFDAFLVHSRGSFPVPIDGDFATVRAERESEDPEVARAALEHGVLIRTDTAVPVMIYATETDLTLLGYSYARQPDTDLIRTWEVAGTSHADAQFLRAVIGGPRDPGVGSLLGCTSVNTGAQKETITAAYHHLVSWAAGGSPPPTGDRIEMLDGDEPTIARDEHGNALGGVRNPLVDVPAATLSGDPPDGTDLDDLTEGDTDVCLLFGSTTPFDQQTLVDLYGTEDVYLDQFRASSADIVERGFMLEPDAEALIADIQGFPPQFP
jgi:hypothetical protein